VGKALLTVTRLLLVLVLSLRNAETCSGSVVVTRGLPVFVMCDMATVLVESRSLAKILIFLRGEAEGELTATSDPDAWMTVPNPPVLPLNPLTPALKSVSVMLVAGSKSQEEPLSIFGR
jgi:hypothetical protein